MNTCIGSGCEHPAFCKGMCRSHYARGRKSGDARLDIPVGSIPKKRGRPPCDVEGCNKPCHGLGLCSKHHRRLLQRGGDISDPVRIIGCAWQEGCDRPHFALGLCNTHYSRRFKRRNYLKYIYGITQSEYEARFDSQGRRCLVCLCDTPRGGSGWHIHHDHRCCSGSRSCGQCIVAILCAPCNIGMGGLGDNPEWLERAAALMRGRLNLEKIQSHER